MKTHNFVGEHPDHCFYLIEEGLGLNGRIRYAYCGKSNEISDAHTPDVAMLAAREFVDVLDSLKAVDVIADIANAFSGYDDHELSSIRQSLAKMAIVRERAGLNSSVLDRLA